MHMSSRPAPRDLRASDADRDRAIAVLADAVSDGRLTHEEYSERLSLACTAKTLGELAGLTADLAETPLVHLDGGHVIAGIFGPARREGRWVVPDTVRVTAVRSTVDVDFRQALLQSARVQVYVTTIVGKVNLYVPDGIRVEVTGRALLSLGGITQRSDGQRSGGSGSGGSGRSGSGSGGSGSGGRRGVGRNSGGSAALPADPATPVIEVHAFVLGGKLQVHTPPKPRRFRLFPRR
jgi:Domain of unknown function (DUF1707)